MSIDQGMYRRALARVSELERERDEEIESRAKWKARSERERERAERAERERDAMFERAKEEARDRREQAERAERAETALAEEREEHSATKETANGWREFLDIERAARERAETALRLAATALHLPQDDEPDDGTTVHAYAQGYPMGCPVCEAFDAVLGDGRP